MSWKSTCGLALVAVALAAAGPTPPLRSAPPKDRQAVISNPDWDEKPSGDDVARYYPELAAMKGLPGRAIISCAVRTDGRLEGCRIVTESPRGAGFGEAAVRMATLFKMKPKTRDGTPVEGGSVRIPFNFGPPDSGDVGPPMDPAPAVGRFAFAGRTRSGPDGLGGIAQGNVYVDLSGPAVAAGRRTVWVAVVTNHPRAFEPRLLSYTMAWQAIDCAGRRMARPPTQFFDDAGVRMGWVRPPEVMQTVPSGVVVEHIFDLACGGGKPEGPLLTTLAAVRADSAARFKADPAK